MFALVRSSLLLLQKWVIEDTREQVYTCTHTHTHTHHRHHADMHTLSIYNSFSDNLLSPLQMMYELSLEPVIGASVTEKDWVSHSPHLPPSPTSPLAHTHMLYSKYHIHKCYCTVGNMYKGNVCMYIAVCIKKTCIYVQWGTVLETI